MYAYQRKKTKRGIKVKFNILALLGVSTIYLFGGIVGYLSAMDSKEPECIAYQYETGKPVCVMWHGQTKPTGKQEKEIAPNVMLYRDCDERTAVTMFDGKPWGMEFGVDCETKGVEK